MTLLTDSWYQILRDLRTRLRMPVFIFMSLFQPIVWLLLFPQVFKSLSEIVGGNYLQVLAPGVVVMTVLFGSAWSGMSMLRDIDMGILSKMLATPVTRASVIMGRVVGAMAVLVIQALLIFTLAVILGVNLATGVPGMLLSIALISLLGLGFAAFSNGMALLFRRVEPMMAVINFVALPTIFLSSAFMPADLLPGWLDIVRQFNPVDYAVVGVRSLINDGYVWSELWRSFLVLAGWAIAGITFGALMFRARAD